MKNKFYQTSAAVLFAIVISSAHAAKSVKNDALTIEEAKIDLAQAVTVAEKYVGGKAVHAEFEHHKKQTTFDVEVVKDKKIMKVKVDSTSGKVVSSVEDKEDERDMKK